MTDLTVAVCKELDRQKDVILKLQKNEGQAFSEINLLKMALKDLAKVNDLQRIENFVNEAVVNITRRLQTLEGLMPKIQKAIEALTTAQNINGELLAKQIKASLDLDQKQEDRHKQYCATYSTIRKETSDSISKAKSELYEKIEQLPKADITLNHESVQFDIKKLLEPVAWDARNSYERGLSLENRINVLEKKIEHMILLARRLETK